MEIVDTHAHLNFSNFDRDRDDLIKETLNGGVWMINVGVNYELSGKAIKIAERYREGVYASVGLHPIYSEEGFLFDSYKNLIKSEKVVAIGEIGLDYKSEYMGFKKQQREVFLDQLSLAGEVNLPIIFHCRFAHKDLIEILSKKDSLKGVIHCFAGDWKEAKRYLDMGFYIGFNGVVFKLDLEEVIRKVPLDRVLLETDCPYLTPPQESGRNEPLYIEHIIEKIAQVKGISHKEVAHKTTTNAKNLFNL